MVQPRKAASATMLSLICFVIAPLTLPTKAEIDKSPTAKGSCNPKSGQTYRIGHRLSQLLVGDSMSSETDAEDIVLISNTKTGPNVQVQFELIPGSENLYHIIFMRTRKEANVLGGWLNKNAKIVLFPHTDSANQVFYIDPTEDGWCTIRATHSNRYLTAKPNDQNQYQEGCQIVQGDEKPSNDSHFRFIPMPSKTPDSTMQSSMVVEALQATTSEKKPTSCIPKSDQLYRIGHRLSRLIIGVPTAGKLDGEQVKLLSNLEDGPYTQVRFKSIPGQDNMYSITFVHSNKELDAFYGSVYRDANVVQYTHTVSEKHHFIINATDDGWCTIKASHSNRYLTVDSSEIGSRVIQGGKEPTTETHFRFIPVPKALQNDTTPPQKDDSASDSKNSVIQKLCVPDENKNYRIVHVMSTLILGIPTSSMIDVEPVKLVPNDVDGLHVQVQFKKHPGNNDLYHIVFMHSKKEFNVFEGSVTKNTHVIQYEHTDAAHQLFRMSPTEDGSCTIQASHSSLYLMAKPNSQNQYTAGSNIVQGDREVSKDEYFRFEEIAPATAPGNSTSNVSLCSPNPSKMYRIKHYLSDLIVGIPSASMLDVEPVKLLRKDAMGFHVLVQFEKFRGNNMYHIVFMHSKKEFNIFEGSLNRNTHVIQYDHTDAKYQLFYIKQTDDGWCTIQAVHSGRYLTVKPNAQNQYTIGGNLVQGDKEISKDEYFQFEDVEELTKKACAPMSEQVYRIVHRLGKMIVAVSSGSKEVDAPVKLAANSETADFARVKFKQIPGSTNLYSISFNHSNLEATVSGASTHKDAIVVQHNSGSPCGRFYIGTTKDGWCTIRAAHSGRYLTALANEQNLFFIGSQVVQGNRTADKSAHFHFEPVASPENTKDPDPDPEAAAKNASAGSQQLCKPGRIYCAHELVKMGYSSTRPHTLYECTKDNTGLFFNKCPLNQSCKVQQSGWCRCKAGRKYCGYELKSLNQILNPPIQDESVYVCGDATATLVESCANRCEPGDFDSDARCSSEDYDRSCEIGQKYCGNQLRSWPSSKKPEPNSLFECTDGNIGGSMKMLERCAAGCTQAPTAQCNPGGPAMPPDIIARPTSEQTTSAASEGKLCVPSPTRIYHILHRTSDTILGVPMGTQKDSDPVKLLPRHEEGPHVRVQFKPVPGSDNTYQILFMHSRKEFATDEGSAAKYSRLVQYKHTQVDSHYFNISQTADDWCTMKAVHSNRCLIPEANTVGSQIVQGDHDPSIDAHFRFKALKQRSFTSEVVLCTPGKFYCGSQLQELGYSNSKNDTLYECDKEGNGQVRHDCALHVGCVAKGDYGGHCNVNYGADAICGWHLRLHNVPVENLDDQAVYIRESPTSVRMSEHCDVSCSSNNFGESKCANATVSECPKGKKYCGVDLIQVPASPASNPSAIYECGTGRVADVRLVKECPDGCRNARCLTNGVARKSSEYNNFIPAAANCFDQLIDLIFLIDGSGSVTERVFKKHVLPFVQSVTQIFQVGPDKTRIGVIQFSHTTQSEFNLNAYNDHDSLEKAISNIKYLGGGSRLEKAIEFMNLYGFSEDNGSRPVDTGVRHIAVVITDGRSSDDNVLKAADDARRNGISMYAIGATSGIDERQLEQIVGDKSNYAPVNSFKDLGGQLRAKVLERICSNDFDTALEGKSSTGTPPTEMAASTSEISAKPSSAACTPKPGEPYHIEHRLSRLYLGDPTAGQLDTEEVKLVPNTETGLHAQVQFKPAPGKQNFFHIAFMHSRKELNVEYGSTQGNAPVIQYHPLEALNQMFSIEDTSDGWCAIRAAHSNRYLTINNNGQNAFTVGSLLVQGGLLPDTASHFRLIPLAGPATSAAPSKGASMPDNSGSGSKQTDTSQSDNIIADTAESSSSNQDSSDASQPNLSESDNSQLEAAESEADPSEPSLSNPSDFSRPDVENPSSSVQDAAQELDSTQQDPEQDTAQEEMDAQDPEQPPVTPIPTGPCMPCPYQAYHMIHRRSNLVVGVPTDSKKNGQPAKLMSKSNEGLNTQIYFKRVSENKNLYYIGFLHSDKEFSVKGKSKRKHAKVVQSTHAESRNQQFYISETGDGWCTIRASHSKRYLTATANKKNKYRKGSQIIQRNRKPNRDDHFRFESLGYINSDSATTETTKALEQAARRGSP